MNILLDVVENCIKAYPANYHLISLICEDGIIHWPDSTNLPESRISQLFYSAMYHAIDCVGINTSAMLDAICVKITCSTLMRPEFSLTQEKVYAFQKVNSNKCLKQFYDMKAYIHYCSLRVIPNVVVDLPISVLLDHILINRRVLL